MQLTTTSKPTNSGCTVLQLLPPGQKALPPKQGSTKMQQESGLNLFDS